MTQDYNLAIAAVRGSSLSFAQLLSDPLGSFILSQKIPQVSETASDLRGLPKVQDALVRSVF